MSNPINNLLESVIEELDRSIDEVIKTSQKIKKNIRSSIDQADMEDIRKINANLCKFTALDGIANTLRNIKK